MTCRADHRDPQRQGECSCADSAAYRAEMLSADCAWPTAEGCRESAIRCAEDGEVYRCRRHHVDSRAVGRYLAGLERPEVRDVLLGALVDRLSKMDLPA